MNVYRNYSSLGLLSISMLLLSYSCKHDTTSLIGNWIQQSDYNGVARSGAAAFSVGNKGYVGGGYDGEERLSDYWAYDSDKNNWTQIADFPGVARNGAVAFSANGKGYVGTGYDGNSKLKDFWSYDPSTNTWDSIAPFAGSARYGAVAFSINNIGYVGTGYDGNYLKDLYAYDPSTNTWSEKTSYGGSKRRNGVAFVLDGKGYICTGINNGTYEDDFYMYDPTSDTWTVKRKIANVSSQSYDDNYAIERSNGVAFTIGGKAYVGMGIYTSPKKDIWEYDPITDLWKQKTSFEGRERSDAVAFTTDSDRGFVTTGTSSTYYFDDIWEFKPNDDYNSAD